MFDDRHTTGAPQGSQAPSVGPERAAELVREGALVVDVREHHEWHAGHAEDAVHVPLTALAARLHELPRDRSLVCVCRSGARSAAAADALHRAGFKVWNLAGGMSAWSEKALPIVDISGQPGVVI